MCSLRPLAGSLFLLLSTLLAILGSWPACAPRAHAESIRSFALDGAGEQSLTGDTLTVTLAAEILDGVCFDAVLSVVGSADLTQTSSGLGVVGGSSPLNDGESLTFSLVLEDVQGGTVRFEGFDAVVLKFFSSDGEQAVFSLDEELASDGDNFLVATPDDGATVNLAAHRPLAFSLFGRDDGATASFRVDSIAASFAATPAVPEAPPLLLLGPLLLAAAVRARRAARA